MGQTKYKVYELSARAVMSYAQKANGTYSFHLSRSATERCRVFSALHEQDSKLYAYNGLMLSSGVRMDGVDIDRPHRVIVIDNPIRTVHGVRVITVEDDGNGSLADNPRGQIGHTRRTLCAWCSIPDTKTAAPKAEWQFQTSIFSPSTKGQWIIRFDGAVADALELGPLRSDNIEIPQELEARLKAVAPKGVPFEMLRTLIAYYEANKPEDSDWVVLLVANFDAYFGSTSFGRKYLKLIPEEILEWTDSGFGICRYRIREGYRA